MRYVAAVVFALLLLGPEQARAQVTGATIEASGPSGPLRGTIIGPADARAPAVLIIPGSGPTDRDGNSPTGVLAAPYRMLAEAMAAAGVTSVRIDKRGMFGSAQAAVDANAVTIPDYVADVRSWVAAIRQRTGASCIWLLGHSEGGLVALAAAGQVRDLCGLILVATPGQPLGMTLRDQLRANPANAPVLEPAMAAIARLEAGERVDTAGMHPALAALFAPAVQGFLISAFSYDPAALAGQVNRPMLVVQGLRDLQVSEGDARRLAAANPGARLLLLPQVNHVLKQVGTDDRSANVAAYADPSLPLADGVAQPIVDFIRNNRAAAR